jgi:hypothetical protein
MEREDLSVSRCKATRARIRDLETIDSELRLVAALRRAVREQGGPLPSMAAADALLDERCELTGVEHANRDLSSC